MVFGVISNPSTFPWSTNSMDAVSLILCCQDDTARPAVSASSSLFHFLSQSAVQ
jgi:hypothetical protein